MDNKYILTFNYLNLLYFYHKQKCNEPLTQVSDAFKFTRYPDFNNHNMNYKYCLKFLLVFFKS